MNIIGADLEVKGLKQKGQGQGKMSMDDMYGHGAAGGNWNNFENEDDGYQA